MKVVTIEVTSSEVLAKDEIGRQLTKQIQYEFAYGMKLNSHSVAKVSAGSFLLTMVFEHSEVL